MEHLTPARIGIQEPPPDSVLADLFHTATAVEEGHEHALTELNDANILLCLCGFGSVVGNGVFLGDGRDDEGGVEADQCLSQGSKLGVSPTDDNIARDNGVGDVATAALGVLASLGDADLEVGVLVEDLLYPAVVAALLWLDLDVGSSATLLKLFIAEVDGSGQMGGVLFGGGVAGRRGRGTVVWAEASVVNGQAVADVHTRLGIVEVRGLRVAAVEGAVWVVVLVVPHAGQGGGLSPRVVAVGGCLERQCAAWNKESLWDARSGRHALWVSSVFVEEV